MKKILIDAGHYKGYNQSPIYKQYFEGDKMWILHLLLKEYLESTYIVQVDTTRKSITKDMNVFNRGYMSKGYDGFYSLHSNSCGNINVDRVVIIRGIGEKSLDAYCKKLGDGIKGIMGVRDNTEVFEKEYKKGEYYGVLRGAKEAGIKNRFIIEHSFHSNKASATWLYDDDNLKKLAKVEGDIIAEHHKLERKSFDIKMIRIKEDVNYRNKADFSKDEYVKGICKKGEVFTVVDSVKSNNKTDMYKLKSGYYVTTSSKYVEDYK